MRFIDEVKLEIRAGHGGSGSRSFRREKYIPKGGPDGGNGGRGGHVMLVASRDRNTLQELYLRKHLFAKNGVGGMGGNRHGRDGEDICVQVPIGTVVRDEEGYVLCDLTHDGQKVYLARGGRGGLGNSNFATSTNQAPRYAQPGLEGEEGIRFLELKSMADVGLLGLPNAGKSTLISRVSNARPKVADYPFTTMAPALGQVFTDDDDSFAMADIPGLIAGAHEGRGLGDRFLRHIERTGLLLHVVDVVSPDERTVVEQIDEIEGELAGAHADLMEKSRFLVLNKIDALDEESCQAIAQSVADRGLPVFAVSAVSGAGIPALLHATWKHVKAARKAAAIAEQEQQEGDDSAA